MTGRGGKKGEPRRSTKAKALDLEGRLGHRFRDPALLESALTHPSCLPELKGAAREHYERLEFLGDSLLGFLVSEALYRKDPGADEGVLTRRRQSVVRTQALAEAAASMGLGTALRLGRGEDLSGGRSRPGLLADAFEALLGAVYLDGGVRAARSLVGRHLGPVLKRASGGGDAAAPEDFKTRLQEEVQAVLHVTPVYRLARVAGPPHERRFESEVLLAGEALGRGEGPSRKAAEQEAARRALERLHDDETNR